MPKSPSLKFSHFNYLAIGFLTILVLTITSLNLYLFLHKKPTVLGIQASPHSERQYWQSLASKTPTFRDAWIEIAKLDTEMGNINHAEVALTKAKTIDPNSVAILDVEKDLLKE